MLKSFVACMLGLLVLAGASTASARDFTPPPPEAAAKVDKFLGQIKQGKTAQAFEDVFAGSIMSKKQAEIEQAVGMVETLLRYYGPVRDWSQFSGAELTSNYRVVNYMARTDNGPIFVSFQLYNNGSRWSVQVVNFTDLYSNAKNW